jgi:hypothetical protein
MLRRCNETCLKLALFVFLDWLTHPSGQFYPGGPGDQEPDFSPASSIN